MEIDVGADRRCVCVLAAVSRRQLDRGDARHGEHEPHRGARVRLDGWRPLLARHDAPPAGDVTV